MKSVPLQIIRIGLAAGALLLASGPLFAVNTMSQTDQSAEDFEKGELKSTSLSSDGALTIAPAMESLFHSEEAIVWDALPLENGDAYLSTGHDGKVFHYKAELTSATLVCDLAEVEATALALAADGGLYVGASPGGIIYKVLNDDDPTTFFKTGATYVWDLATDENGTLFAATGNEGKIFSISADGEGELFYDAKADNVLSLIKVPGKPLLAATQKPAMVMEIADDKSARVLLDAPYEESRRAVWGPDGAVYAALNAEKVSPLERVRAAASGSSGAPPTPPSKAPPSQIVKINGNGFVQTIWFSPDDPIHTLHYDETRKAVIAAAGMKGALFEARDDGSYSRLLQIEEKAIAALAPTADGLLLGAAESGAVYRLSGAPRLEGVYLSEPMDAGDPVRWGNLRLRAETPKDTSLTVAIRQGNTKDPEDGTWTDWTLELAPVNQFARIPEGPYRFTQYRATLKRRSAETASPTLDAVEMFYLTPNLPPIIKEVKIEAAPDRSNGAAAGASGASRPSPTPPRTGATASSSSSEQSQGGDAQPVAAKPNSNSRTVNIQWKIEDPNSDEMEADLFFKGENETRWKKINKTPIRGASSHAFETASIPDGQYRILLKASDLPSNPPELAEAVELRSDPFTVDNTAPRIVEMELTGAEPLRRRLVARAEDATSIIADAHYTINAGEWKQAFPSDLIFDQTEESFDIFIEFEEPGEHVITLRVVDREGNTALSKRVIVVEGEAGDDSEASEEN